MARRTYTWNPYRLSDTEVAQVLYQAGLTNPAAIAALIPIAMRESGGRAGVHGSDSPMGNLSGDRGLFQINSTHDKRLIAAGIIRSPRDLFDPVVNARAAIFLSNGGDQRVMRQLWGLGKDASGNTTWVGERGNLPAPNIAAVQRAQSSGLLNRPYTPMGGMGGGAASPGGPGMAPGPGGMTQGVADWLASQNGAPLAQQFFDILNAQNLSQSGTDVAYTEMQRDYARKMAGFEQSLLGLNLQGVGFDRQALDVEQAYNEAISRLNQGLTKSQQDSNLKTWKELGRNISRLRELSNQGLANTKEYLQGARALENDILKSTQKWLGQQKGFNQRDYRLALGAIGNVLRTETDRFTLARQQAQFQEDVSRREELSDATARGATTSQGFGDANIEFERRRRLAEGDARVTWQDAQRQGYNARERARLGFDQTYAGLNNQGTEAAQRWRAAMLAQQQQRNNAQLDWAEQQEGLRSRQARGYIDFGDRGAQLGNQAGQQAARDAFNSAMYGLNKAGLALTGRRYGIQAGQSQAQLANTEDQLWYQLASGLYSNPIYMGEWPDPYGTMGVGSGPPTSGGGIRNASPSPSRPGLGGGTGRSGLTTGSSRPRSAFDAQPV